MAWNWVDDDDDDLDDEGQEPQGKPASNLPNEARKHLRKVEKQLAEANAKVAEYEKSKRRGELSTKVKDLGYAEGIANLVPENVSDEDGLKKWLDEHGSLFAKAAPAGQGDSGTDESQDPDELDPDLVEAMMAMQNVTATATPGNSGQRATLAAFQNAKSKEDLDNLIAKALVGGTR